MFDNAQQYNRPDSRIYRDAVKLQKYVQNKAEEIMSMDDEVGGGDPLLSVFFSTSSCFYPFHFCFSYLFILQFLVSL